MAFCWPCKTTSLHYRCVGQLGSTNQNCWDAKLLPMSVSISPVYCVHLCHLLRTQHHCLCPHGRKNPPNYTCTPSALLSPFIHNTCDITEVIKNYLKNQQWILHGRVSYDTALLIQQVWCGYNVAQKNHSYSDISKWYFSIYKMWWFL